MNFFDKKRKPRHEVNLKNIKGEKIREQYFNLFICLLIFAFFNIATVLTIVTLTDGEGTKFTSVADFFDFILLGIKYLILPVILSVLNRFVFGEIICVLDDVGITFSGGFIRWDSITDIIYVIDFPTKHRFGCCYARVIGKDINIKIYSAPVFLLLRARKYNKNIKVRYSKFSIATIVLFAVGPSLIVTILSLLDKK